MIAGVSIFALSNRVLLPAPGTISRSANTLFQYSLCRIVYCCLPATWRNVAALSRFNIRSVESCTAATAAIVVNIAVIVGFNIRSVESCTAATARRAAVTARSSVFQYSLCRIVYCCQQCCQSIPVARAVSIFALSNRVLLPRLGAQAGACVEMFQYSLCRIVYCCLSELAVVINHFFSFNIRSVESCTAATSFAPCKKNIGNVSIFALSNRVLLP